MLFIANHPILCHASFSKAPVWIHGFSGGNAHLGRTSHAQLSYKRSDHHHWWSLSAMLHSQCHEVPEHSVDVNYLSLTVVLGVQEGVELLRLKLPLTMENRDGRRDGKKGGGSSSDHSRSLRFTPSHPSSFACSSVTTAGGKCCKRCRRGLIIITNQQQAGPVVRLQDNARARRVPRISMSLGSSSSSRTRLPREKGEAGSRGRLGAGAGWPRLLAQPGERRLHTHARTQRAAHTRAAQPPGAAPLIREGGNKNLVGAAGEAAVGKMC